MPAEPLRAMHGAEASPAGARPDGWDTHVHVFDAAAPVRPGHYRPGDHPLARIESTAAAAGIGHLVIVQPSVYGTDNQVLLQALADGGGAHRGVAVVDPDIADDALAAMHAAGVRGVRFNTVSPTGHAGDPGEALRALAPRLRALGWHVQWYVPSEALPALRRWQVETGLRFVIDHLGSWRQGQPEEARRWAALRALADAGAWIKLSGWYRLGAAAAPYREVDEALARVAACFGERCVWGSDWPHTGLPTERLPRYPQTLAPLQRVLGQAQAQRVCTVHAATLYGP